MHYCLLSQIGRMLTPSILRIKIHLNVITEHMCNQSERNWLLRYNINFVGVSLLTDPRLKDEDYLFWGDNPFAPPPESVEYIEDLNTGEAHLNPQRDDDKAKPNPPHSSHVC